MASTSDAQPFELRIGTRAPALVLSLRGREELSHPFRFDVRVLVDVGEDPTVGERATLAFSTGDGPGRAIHGVIDRVAADSSVLEQQQRGFRVRLVPRLALLRHAVDSRVHQDATVPEVVKDVLAHAGIRVEEKLSRTYPKRAYCVQYKETTLAFVRRILAEEGIFFAFDHGNPAGGDDNVVLMDTAEAYGRLAPHTLSLRQRDAREGRAGQADDVLTFELRRAVASSSLQLRDYDFQRPLLDVSSTAREPNGVAVGETQLSAYEHRGPYMEAEIEPHGAEVALEQRRRRAVTGHATSTSRSIAPGLTFQLEVEGANELSGAYAVVAIDHDLRPASANQGLLYENKFSCVPADFARRPARPKQRLHQVLETALVVGPGGEEVHTDAFGRVQVRFHWQLGDGPSTWLRVMQPWAGASFGAQFVPRVGSEVMVTFLGGDQDAPVVVGGVYNATNPAPFGLPAQKTRTGFRTRSSPGGAGANELSFEDASGEEQVRLIAQRDFDTTVGRDATLHVKRDVHRVVDGDETSTGAGDLRHAIGGASALTVGGAASLRVGGARTESVAGPLTIDALAGRAVQVVGLDVLDVKGARDETIEADATLRVVGSSTTLVGTPDAPRSLVLHANGASTLSATDMIEIASDKGIRLRCGTSVIEIGPDRIGVSANTIELRSPKARVLLEDDSVRITADQQLRVVCKEAIVKTDDASISVTTEVQIDGKQILLNSPADAKDELEDEPAPPTSIDLVDESGKPIAHQLYELVMADGSRRSGFLDENGHADLDLDADAMVVFPGLPDAASA